MYVCSCLDYSLLQHGAAAVRFFRLLWNWVENILAWSSIRVKERTFEATPILAVGWRLLVHICVRKVATRLGCHVMHWWCKSCTPPVWLGMATVFRWNRPNVLAQRSAENRGRGRPSSSGDVDDQAALTPKALDGFTTGVGTLSLAIGWTTGPTLSMLGSSAAFPDLPKLFGDTGRGTKWVKKNWDLQLVIIFRKSLMRASMLNWDLKHSVLWGSFSLEYRPTFTRFFGNLFFFFTNKPKLHHEEWIGSKMAAGLDMLNRPVVSASLRIQRTQRKRGNEGGGGRERESYAWKDRREDRRWRSIVISEEKSKLRKC